METNPALENLSTALEKYLFVIEHMNKIPVGSPLENHAWQEVLKEIQKSQLPPKIPLASTAKSWTDKIPHRITNENTKHKK